MRNKILLLSLMFSFFYTEQFAQIELFTGRDGVSKYEVSTGQLTKLYSTFKPFSPAQFGTPIQGIDSKLYGMTETGGLNNAGTIYSLNPTNNIQNILFDFTASSGSNPKGSLLLASDGKLYGMTSAGGIGFGTIFSFDPNTNLFVKIHEFTNSNGASPYGSLIQATNGKLYGMTTFGGLRWGTIFSLDPVTNFFTKLYDFENINGAYPYGSLMQASNGLIYGTTYGSDPNTGFGLGTIFQFNPNTNTYNRIHEFNGNDGSFPSGSLVEATNGKLYGLTTGGGSIGNGTIFTVDPLTNVHAKLFDFNNTNGASPWGNLAKAVDGKLYGMTSSGGSNTYGTIFSFDPNANIHKKLTDLESTQGVIGRNPYGSLLQASNGKLYGTTRLGGNFNGGTLISYTVTNNTIATILSNDIADGFDSRSTLLQLADKKLYGTTRLGGNYSVGTIFSFNPLTNAYNKLYDFNIINGANPNGSLIQASNGQLYGTSISGGNFGFGVLYSFDPVNKSINKIYDFDNTNGRSPRASLLQSQNGKIYGTALGGISGYNGFGTIFSYDPLTATFSNDFNFSSSDGGIGIGGGCTLVESESGILYGMTSIGGINSVGTIFSFDPSSNAFKKLFDFNSLGGNSPLGSVLLANNGKLYGITSLGGKYNYGTLFSFDLVSNSFTKLYDFDLINGGPTYCDLMQASDGLLYGSSVFGGNNNLGVIFSFDITTNTYKKLQDFDLNNGSSSFYGALTEVCVEARNIYYQDIDGDGFGDPLMTIRDCKVPSGYVVNNTDNCPTTYNPDQSDNDFDGIGDVCDTENRFILNASSECLPNVSLSINKITDADKIEWFRNGILVNTVIPSAAASGITVAGGNGNGSSDNQLNFPSGVVLDSNKNIFVADLYNYRIQKWIPGSTSGSTIISAYSPTDVVVDRNGGIYIPDPGANSIEKWVPGASFVTTVAGGKGSGSAANQFNTPLGLFVDASGNIFIADTYNHRVQKWAPGSTSGVTVAGGNGDGSAPNQLSRPNDIFVDENDNIYIADLQNHRVQKWTSGAAIGVTVAGGNGQGSASNQLNAPTDVFVDNKGYIFVSDAGNHRIQRWPKLGTTGITVAGGNGYGSAVNQLNNPVKLFINSGNEIFICDSYNDRIQKWAAPVINTSFNPTLPGVYSATVTRNGLQIPTSSITINSQPVLTSKGSMEINTDPGKNTALVSESQLLANLNFDENISSPILFSPAAGTFPIGISEITATITNNCGTISSKFNLLISDKEIPSISCQSNVSVKADDGKCTAALTLLSPSTNDNDAVASITNNAPVNFQFGTTTIKWLVTDRSGNTNECEQTITVTSNPEICNGIDDNCDGVVDEGCVIQNLPTLTLNNTLVLEGNSGNKNAYFLLTLSSISQAPITVQYQTSIGSATSPEDFTAKSGTITFPPNSQFQILTIQVNGDNIYEPNENFSVNLNSPVNVILSKSSAIATIINDDLRPTLRIDDAVGIESNRGVSVRVRLNKPSNLPVRVKFDSRDGTAQSSTDYIAIQNGELVFMPGELEKIINVRLIDDNITENTERFFIRLRDAENASLERFLGGKNEAIINIQNSTSVIGQESLHGKPEMKVFEDEQDLQIFAMPNPSQNYFQLNFKSNQKGIIRLYITDLLGRVIEERVIYENDQQIQIGHKWRPGNYILLATQGNQRKTIQLVKLK